LQKAFTLIPGMHRLNQHASYGEFGGTDSLFELRVGLLVKNNDTFLGVVDNDFFINISFGRTDR
jgi:hypothetical protein